MLTGELTLMWKFQTAFGYCIIGKPSLLEYQLISRKGLLWFSYGYCTSKETGFISTIQTTQQAIIYAKSGETIHGRVIANSGQYSSNNS